MEDRTAPAAGLLVAAAGPGGGPHVKVFDSATRALRAEFFAYESTFRGGVAVATGDLTGDGVDDLVTAPGVGGGPLVKAYDGAALLNGVVRELFAFFAYDTRFRGGASLALEDLTGDSVPDVITGAGPGGGPHVKVFSGADRSLTTEWLAYAPTFTGGVTVAAGPVGPGGDSTRVVTAPGAGMPPLVRVFLTIGTLSREFLAYDGAFRGGVNVAVGRVAGPNAAIVTAPGAGGGPHVRAFGPDGAVGREFLAYDASFRGGVAVAALDVTGDGVDDVVTAPGPGGGPHVKVFGGATGGTVSELFAFDAAFRGGVAVAALAPVDAAATTIAFDFRQGAQGWQAGFANVPADPAERVTYELDEGIRPLPAELGTGTGYMMQSNNRSDATVMFLKRRLGTADGIVPGQRYRAQFRLDIGSNEPSGGFGAGGAPGEAVRVVAGAGAQEPQLVPGANGQQVLNVNLGETGVVGRYVSDLGHIANGRTAVQPGPKPYVSIARYGAHEFVVQAGADGTLWLLIGTRSGYEGFTRVFHQRVSVTLTPLTAGP